MKTSEDKQLPQTQQRPRAGRRKVSPIPELFQNRWCSIISSVFSSHLHISHHPSSKTSPGSLINRKLWIKTFTMGTLAMPLNQQSISPTGLHSPSRAALSTAGSRAQTPHAGHHTVQGTRGTFRQIYLQDKTLYFYTFLKTSVSSLFLIKNLPLPHSFLSANT